VIGTLFLLSLCALAVFTTVILALSWRAHWALVIRRSCVLSSIGIGFVLLGMSGATPLESMLHNGRGLALASLFKGMAAIPLGMGIVLLTLGVLRRSSKA
jgi:hypothetical protein